MKKSIICLVCLISAFMVSAQTERGFRGFVDLGYTISTSELQVTDGYSTETYDVSNRLYATFTGGYQCMPEFFIGVGAGVSYWHQTEDSSIGVPIFADLRYDLRLDSPFSFFVDARIGYSVVDIEGLYVSPFVGARYALNDKMGLNLGVGYEVQKQKDIEGSLGGLTFKLGFDF